MPAVWFERTLNGVRNGSRKGLVMGRSVRSDLTRRLREAHAACEESAATGIPLDEVSGMRAERRAAQRRAAREAAEAYNDAVRRVRERGAPEDHVAKWVAMENVKRVGRREFLKGAGTAAAGIAAAGLAGGVVFEPRRASAATSKQPASTGTGSGQDQGNDQPPVLRRRD